MNYYSERKLSPKALELVQFDADSIRQVVAAERLPAPETWLADPGEYEKAGRFLRDSDSPRMLAYSAQSHVLYATDGCNSCARRLMGKLESLPKDELQTFAQENEIRFELLERLTILVGQRPNAGV